ncbi:MULTISPECIES: hypothetical protein [unclassified Pseudoclavibacter]|uniref:hypothetical protein n=1 Tax=unclassified Pseudoclavibacter TaxID=2615177 RepID=UPI0012EF32EA|nr:MULTISPECIES: hypothetical protein [unclassified Pseudoclavibacter]MBF4457835.1 hypothetical protein [Pseudoclavibacter sp. VKM Ac-2867]VXC47608.1 conserved hypothetical protein [Pseudoclavibacter sp. 8L]
MTSLAPTSTSEKSAKRSTSDRYWDAYQRRTLPKEFLALSVIGATLSLGFIAAVSAFL